MICACWPRHALAQSCSSFRRQFPPHWGHDARSQSSLPSAFTPTSAPLTPFPRHPRLPRHSRPPEISIYVLPPTKRRARVGQPSFCAGFAAQKLLIRFQLARVEAPTLDPREHHCLAYLLGYRSTFQSNSAALTRSERRHLRQPQLDPFTTAAVTVLAGVSALARRIPHRARAQRGGRTRGPRVFRHNGALRLRLRETTHSLLSPSSWALRVLQ